MSKSDHEIGILLSFAGYSSWVAADVFAKLAAETYSIVQILMLEGLVGILVMPLIAQLDGGYRQLGSRRPWFQLLSSLLVVGATSCAIAGVVYLSLADFYTIVFTAPLIMTCLGILFLNEKPNRSILLATLAGFGGVVIAVRFTGSAGHELSWVGVAVTCVTALSMSLAMLMVRAAPGENNYALAFWPRVLGFSACFVLLVCSGDVAHWDFSRIYYPIGVGLTGALGALLTNLSLRYAPIAIVSPYHYTQIIFGALAGYLIWHNVPALSIMIGAVIITGSGLYILRRRPDAEPVVGPEI